MEQNERLFHDADNNADRQERFAAKIHKDNVLECMRTMGTHLELKCGCLMIGTTLSINCSERLLECR
jgi:hypothetical protein